jgi:hypothetical protein
MTPLPEQQFIKTQIGKDVLRQNAVLTGSGAPEATKVFKITQELGDSEKVKQEKYKGLLRQGSETHPDRQKDVSAQLTASGIPEDAATRTADQKKLMDTAESATVITHDGFDKLSAAQKNIYEERLIAVLEERDEFKNLLSGMNPADKAAKARELLKEDPRYRIAMDQELKAILEDPRYKANQEEIDALKAAHEDAKDGAEKARYQHEAKKRELDALQTIEAQYKYTDGNPEGAKAIELETLLAEKQQRKADRTTATNSLTNKNNRLKTLNTEREKAVGAHYNTTTETTTDAKGVTTTTTKGGDKAAEITRIDNEINKIETEINKLNQDIANIDAADERMQELVAEKKLMESSLPECETEEKKAEKSVRQDGNGRKSRRQKTPGRA